MNKRILKTENGFTMMELIVVLAIMGVISAILLPSFLSTTDRTRLKSDILSINTAQNALDLYIAETNGNIPQDAKQAVQMLENNKYLSGSKFQTDKAEWGFSSGKLVIDITNCEPNIHDIVQTLTVEEQSKIAGTRI